MPRGLGRSAPRGPGHPAGPLGGLGLDPAYVLRSPDGTVGGGGGGGGGEGSGFGANSGGTGGRGAGTPVRNRLTIGYRSTAHGLSTPCGGDSRGGSPRARKSARRWPA